MQFPHDVKVAVIMRGVPGSGKTTHAAKYFPDFRVCSADKHRTQPDGSYRFRPEETAEAHAKCLNEWLVSLVANEPRVLVDNTNVRLWEASPYVMTAHARGYAVVIVETLGAWKNVHDVPEQVVSRMRRDWEEIPKFWPIIILRKVHCHE